MIQIMTRHVNKASPDPRLDTSASEQGLIRLAALTSVPGLLRSFGQDPAVIVESVGLKLEFFNDPEFKIPFATMGRLFTHCVEATQCRYFGLLTGERVTPNLLGLAGFVMQHAVDVETALNDTIHYTGLHDKGSVLSLGSHNGTSLFEHSIYLDGVESSGQITDGALAVLRNIMQCLCGPAWKPQEVLFAHKQPVDSTPYRKCFGAPVRFNADRNALVFSSDWLKARPPRANPWLYDYLKQQAEQINAQDESDFAGGLQPLLRILLLSSKCTLAEASKQLGIHSRTLNRRLQAEGTTFRDEVAKAGYIMACQYLAQSSAPVSDIAVQLGYSNTSGFAHAFKRWSGMTPSEWRSRSGES